MQEAIHPQQIGRGGAVAALGEKWRFGTHDAKFSIAEN
jgi:hypothetical protein